MKLVSLPDCKKYHQYLHIGQTYVILGTIGNGYIIQPDGCEDRIAVLQSRFK